MHRFSRAIWILCLIGALHALDVDDIKRISGKKTESVIQDSTRKREQIMRRFSEFVGDMEKVKPGLNLSLPVDAEKAGKMRIMDHNALPGMPEFQKIYAIVTEDTMLKTWHSDTDSQNLEKVQAGERVEVVMVFNFRALEQGTYQWALIRRASGTEGYLPKANLKNVPEEKVANTTAKEKKYVYISDGLRMRSEPSLSGEFVVLIPYNAEVMVTAYTAKKDTIDARSDYWAKVDYENQQGWVFNAYLRPVAHKPPPEPPQVNPSGFAMPVQGKMTSKFGSRIDPVTKKAGTMHRGIDIAAPKGTPIKAAKDGEVHENSSNKWWGNYVVLNHGQNIYTMYCHQSRATARKGSRVSQGQEIGLVGSTGKSTGPHLHFEVWVGSNKDITDPLKYLPQ